MSAIYYVIDPNGEIYSEDKSTRFKALKGASLDAFIKSNESKKRYFSRTRDVKDNLISVEIPKDIAGIMLSAILSDTLLFKSPTTTPLDIEVGNALALIAGENIEEYGYKMFKAASSVAGLSVDDIINTDCKTFKYGESNMAIGQVITMDFDELLERKDEIVDKLNSMCEHGKFSVSLLFVTDVIKNGSYLFFNDNSEEILEEAYGIEHANQGVYLDGMVSRKKQMLPPLLEIQDRR